MAAINYYISSGTRRNLDLTDLSETNSGTSSTAGDWMEFRAMVQDGSNNATNLQRIDVIKFLETILKFYKQNGLVGDGTNVPIP